MVLFFFSIQSGAQGGANELQEISRSNSTFNKNTPIIARKTQESVLKLLGDPTSTDFSFGVVSWKYKCSNGTLNIKYGQYTGFQKRDPSKDYVVGVAFFGKGNQNISDIAYPKLLAKDPVFRVISRSDDKFCRLGWIVDDLYFYISAKASTPVYIRTKSLNKQSGLYEDSYQWILRDWKTVRFDEYGYNVEIPKSDMNIISVWN